MTEPMEGSAFDNGWFLPDREVWKEAEKTLSIFDWIFHHEKVTNEIIWAHSRLAEKDW